MAGAFVQGWSKTEGSGVTTTTVDVDTIGATANNLLVATLCHRLAGAITAQTATGYTSIQSHSGAGDAQSEFWYRVASGTTADDFSPSWTGASRTSAIVQEFSGLASSSPLDDSAEDIGSVATTVITMATGTATPVSANGLAVAMLAAYEEVGWDTATTVVDSSYTNLSVISIGGSRPLSAMASIAYTSTAGQGPTFDTDAGESGTKSYGAVAAFKEPAAGVAIPLMYRHYQKTRAA